MDQLGHHTNRTQPMDITCTWHDHNDRKYFCARRVI